MPKHSKFENICERAPDATIDERRIEALVSRSESGNGSATRKGKRRHGISLDFTFSPVMKTIVQIKRRKSADTAAIPPSLPLHLNGYTKDEHKNLRQVEYLDNELRKYRECLESMRPKQCIVSNTELMPLSNREAIEPCEEDYPSATVGVPVENGIPSDMLVLTSSQDQFNDSDTDACCEPPHVVTNVTKVISRTVSPLTRELADDAVGPTMEFSIQESLSVTRRGSNGDCTVTEIMNKKTLTPSQSFDGTLSLDHHMSIFIRRLDLREPGDSFHCSDVDNGNGVSEKASIINALFDKKQRENRSLMQKYFMRWVHFNTIEKLTKRNPDQTRLRKMETFLQNITLERKKTMEKLKAINRTEANRYSVAKPKFTAESPELLARKFNNK